MVDLNHRAVQYRNPTHKKIHTIGILSTDRISRMIDLQKMVTDHLELRNPKIYSYKKYHKDDVKSYKHFTENDFNWKGEVMDTSLQGFIEQPFDLLVCFFKEPPVFLEYAALLSKAIFKVGFADVNPELFDLQLSVNESEEKLFFEELKRYLIILDKL